ncbi:carboxylesterase type b [Paramyrothecium foliicola]|nr:carboxylesterase type b [Paramyrothecium foliicola]
MQNAVQLQDIAGNDTSASTRLNSDDGSLETNLCLDIEKTSKEHHSQSYLIRLVLGIAGTQVAFAIQFATGISHFQSLGISQSAATLVWFIPPICGTFLQPLFGRWSDAQRQRKPFIIFGSLGMAMALAGYAWAPDLGALILNLPSDSPSLLVQIAVLIFFLILNISVHAVQSTLRALVVDECDAKQQVEAIGWMSRVNFATNIICYLAAASDLPTTLLLASTQLQALVNLCILIIIASVGVTCYSITESGAQKTTHDHQTNKGIIQTWKLISPQLRRIYLAQFFSWFAWFPLLVQITR